MELQVRRTRLLVIDVDRSSPTAAPPTASWIESSTFLPGTGGGAHSLPHPSSTRSRRAPSQGPLASIPQGLTPTPTPSPSDHGYRRCRSSTELPFVPSAPSVPSGPFPTSSPSRPARATAEQQQPEWSRGLLSLGNPNTHFEFDARAGPADLLPCNAGSHAEPGATRQAGGLPRGEPDEDLYSNPSPRTDGDAASPPSASVWPWGPHDVSFRSRSYGASSMVRPSPTFCHSHSTDSFKLQPLSSVDQGQRRTLVRFNESGAATSELGSGQERQAGFWGAFRIQGLRTEALGSRCGTPRCGSPHVAFSAEGAQVRPQTTTSSRDSPRETAGAFNMPLQRTKTLGSPAPRDTAARSAPAVRRPVSETFLIRRAEAEEQFAERRPCESHRDFSQCEQSPRAVRSNTTSHPSHSGATRLAGLRPRRVKSDKDLLSPVPVTERRPVPVSADSRTRDYALAIMSFKRKSVSWACALEREQGASKETLDRAWALGTRQGTPWRRPHAPDAPPRRRMDPQAC